MSSTETAGTVSTSFERRNSLNIPVLTPTIKMSTTKTTGLQHHLSELLRKCHALMKDSPLTVLGLSTKGNPKISDIIQQSLILCEDYIYGRLLRSGLLAEGGRNQNFASDLTGKLSDVSRELQLIGTKLEMTYPVVYQNVFRQVNITAKTDATVRRTMTSVGDFLFKYGIVTWCRVVALMAVAGAVATECVQAGLVHLVPVIVSTVSEVIERHVAVWISRQGGWVEILKAFRVDRGTRYLWALTSVGVLAGFLFTWVTAMQI